MNLLKSKVVALFALGLVFSASAFAETQNVKVSGSLDVYSIYRNNFDLYEGNDAGVLPLGATAPNLPGSTPAGTTSERSDADNFFFSITQVGVSADLTDNVSTVINLINQRDWNANSVDSSLVSSSNAANEFDVLLDLAYVQMKEIFYTPLTMTIGRQDLVFGRGFIIGWNPLDSQGVIQADEFTQIQSFDAIRATLDFNPWTIDFVYSKIAEGSPNPEDDSDLYIAYLNYKFAEYNAVADLYYTGQYDRRTLAAATGTADQETNTVGGRVQFDPISQITLGGELAFQFGEFRSSLGAMDRDRNSWATDIFGEYRWDNSWKPMLGIQYVYLGGESDLSAGTAADYGAWNGAFRGTIYGWIHDYKEVYFATAFTGDQSAGQNQQHLSVYGSMQPMEDLKLTAAWWYFWATDDYHTSTAVPASATLNDEIGNEIDLAAIYSYTEDVTFTVMADWFIPGDLYQSPFDDVATQLISEVKVVF